MFSNFDDDFFRGDFIETVAGMSPTESMGNFATKRKSGWWLWEIAQAVHGRKLADGPQFD